uniref:Uncharacterized protein n=1 Tax=Candidatus Kentrum sp. DK TaxID=2126562 RepID=A0A450SIJ9_9GAMM|nr:MAG: hypothetical protein BECKDK2373B_GA0170837_104124 [Candidatus Kentron sp. DK]
MGMSLVLLCVSHEIGALAEGAAPLLSRIPRFIPPRLGNPCNLRFVGFVGVTVGTTVGAIGIVGAIHESPLRWDRL